MSNVMTDYNAKGDGITDDTQAIQNAIDDVRHNLPSSSSYSSLACPHDSAYNYDTSVYFPNPPRFYRISGSLQLRTGVTLYGENQWKGTLCQNLGEYMIVGDGVNPIFVTGITDTNKADVYQNRNITIIGLSARNGSTSSPGSEVIRLWTAYNFKLINCSFSTYQATPSSSSSSAIVGFVIPQSAVSIYNSSSGTIQDCFITGNGGAWGVTAYEQSNVLNCQNSIITGGTGGGAVDIAGCNVVRFNGCTIQFSLLGFRVCGIHSQGACTGVNLDDNYMEGVGTPYDIGRLNTVNGLSIQRGQINNQHVFSEIHSHENNTFILGSVQGWRIGNGMTVTQETGSWKDMILFTYNGSLPIATPNSPAFAISGEATDINRIGLDTRGRFYNCDSTFPSPAAYLGYITGLNRMQPLRGWMTSGYRVVETATILAAGLPNYAYAPSYDAPMNPEITSSSSFSSSVGVFGFGGVVDSVEVFEVANGPAPNGMSVKIGTTFSNSEIASFDPSDYNGTYNNGQFTVPLNPAGYPVPGTALYRGGGYSLIIFVAPYSGSFSFRIRIKYRGF